MGGRTTNPRLTRAVALIIRAALSKEISVQIEDRELSRRIAKRADDAVESIANEFCGTLEDPRRPLRPMPGPHAPTLELALAVASIANIAVKAESLRVELMKISGFLTKKAYVFDN
jgi:hypothetical protein